MGEGEIMSLLFYGVCLDCKEHIDLDKFYSWSAYCGEDSGYADIDKEDLSNYGEFFVYRSLRLHLFMEKHQGHRIGVYTNNEIEIGDTKEVFPWPGSGNTQDDTVDFSDPKAGRLTIKTRLGDVFIDDLGRYINCFRHINGVRHDVILFMSSNEFKDHFLPPRTIWARIIGAWYVITGKSEAVYYGSKQ